MTQKDVENAKSIVENFLTKNGVNTIYTNSTQGWGLYVNWTNHFISLHGPKSNDWNNAIKQKSNSDPNIFKITRNGFWIGIFPDIVTAYSFAELLKKILYLRTGREVSLASGKDINMGGFRIF